MPSSRRLIASNTLTGTTASVTFSNIPATFTDLVLRISARSDVAAYRDYFTVKVNSLSTGHSSTYVYGLDGAATTGSGRYTSGSVWYLTAGIPGATATASTFGSLEMYVPSYTASQNKPAGAFGVTENNNANNAMVEANALLLSNTAAISTLLIGCGSNFVSGSSFFLYGLVNS